MENGEDEMIFSSSSRKAEKNGQILLSPFFVLFRLSIDWAMSTHIVKGHLLY